YADRPHAMLLLVFRDRGRRDGNGRRDLERRAVKATHDRFPALALLGTRELAVDQDEGAGIQLTYLLRFLAPDFDRLPELVRFAITAQLGHDQHKRGLGHALAVIGHVDTMLADDA